MDTKTHFTTSYMYHTFMYIQLSQKGECGYIHLVQVAKTRLKDERCTVAYVGLLAM